MKNFKADFENWQIECIPEDGARISVLKYAGMDLLTACPPAFNPPEKFYGEYETRPVYGYDDCFPTVDPCFHPEDNFNYRDHGEICWTEWKVNADENNLYCSADCIIPRVVFKRTLKFCRNKLTWKFEVINKSGKKISFLHVMHALMPLDIVQFIKVPGFAETLDEIKSHLYHHKDPQELTQHLLGVKKGTFEMLLLRDIDNGSVKIGFMTGITLQINFDSKMFPTLGIWWNNSGYPDENGLQRCECAFEPIPGLCSNLSKSYEKGIYLSAGPEETLYWEIDWVIEQNINGNYATNS